MPKLDIGAPKMKGHDQRNQGGELRKIRSDTQMETLEERYGVDFGVRDDMEWGTYKKRFDVDSVKEAIRKARK